MSRSRVVPALVPALLVVLLAACGCSSTEHPKAGPTRPTHASSDPRLTPALGSPAALGAVISTPVLKGSKVFYAFGDQPHGRQDRIASTDLVTGKRTVLVSRTFLRGGTITRVALTGWIVYVEEVTHGTEVPGRTEWVVAALDPSTGQRHVLMQGGPAATPSPELTGGREATWVVFPDGGGARPTAYSWAPGHGAPRKADAMPGDAAECTPPTAYQERVAGCSHRGGWWAWTEDPAPGPGVLDDPAYLYVSGGGRRVQVAHLGFDAAAPLLVAGSVLWQSSSGLRVTDLEHLSASTLVAPDGYFIGSPDGRSAAVVREGPAGATARLLRTS